MSRMESAVKRVAHHSYSVNRLSAPKSKLYTTTKAPVAPKAQPTGRDDTQLAVQRLKYIWFVASLKSLFIPAAIFLIAATYDMVPWAPRSGAFVIAAGVMIIMVSFPFVNQYRSLFLELEKEYGRYGKTEPNRFSKLYRLLFIGALFAELPSVMGMLHFMMTYELISSLLLCVPAVIIMFVAYRPDDLQRRPVNKPAAAEAD